MNTAPATAQPSSPRRPSRLWRVLRWILAVLATLLLLLAGILWWATGAGSLPRALQLAQRFLPEGQVLTYSDAQGSIARGGRIGHLQWSSAGTEVTIHNLRLAWSLRLSGRQLYVRTLAADLVHLRLTPQEEPEEPFVMPPELSLPLRVRLPLALRQLQIDTVDAQGEVTTQTIEAIAAGYAYDGVQHAVRLESLRYARSSLQASLGLHARELALAGDVTASLRDLVPERPFTMQVRLTVTGSLAGGEAAQLELQADATEEAREGTTSGALATLNARATVHPWRDQPVQQLDLEAHGLDAHAFHDGAPVTLLGGTARVQPVANGWQVHADIRNAQPGPLDRERLPLDRLLADAHIAPELWRAGNIELQVGSGQLQLSGQFDPRARTVDVRGELRRLPLQHIDARLATSAAAVLSGTLSARGDLARSVAFDADISATADAGAAPRAQWEIRTLQARGAWSPERVRVERVHVDAFGARIDGTDIEAALPDLDSVKARITAAAPGLSLEADAGMGQRTGGGRLSLQLTAAEEVVAWLRGLPLVGERLPALQASGSASLQAEWQGGWRQWIDGLQRPATQPQLRADTRLQAQALHIVLPATTFEVDHLDAALQGNPGAADLVVEGEVRANEARANLDIRMHMAQGPGRAGAPQWTAELGRFAVSVTLPDQSDAWQLEVAEGLQVTARTGAGLALDTTEGRATLAPPRSVAPEGKPLELVWQPLQWSRSDAGATRLQSQGTVNGLSLGWLDALAPAGTGPLAGAGLYTDLVMRGEWDVRMTDHLDIRAQLARESGDLWLDQPVPDTSPGSATADSAPMEATQTVARGSQEGVAAGIRTMAVSLQSEDEAVALTLDWDTDRAGSIEAKLRTALTRSEAGWSLADDAPLSGSVQARVQDLGAWEFVAPPGWRVQGALEADITLEGTVRAPRAQGSIEATGLNIRSVLDGVDLRDGVLRATLQGERLEIAELTLHGGTGSRAYVRGLSGNRTPPPTERGSMTARGTIDWSGAGAADATGSGIKMDVSATLAKMQVLVRNDRQLSLSGELSAGLDEGRLRARGDLTVDRAAIMLPESSAPKLGNDVVVVRGTDAEPEARGRLQTAQPMDLQIQLDLGRDLALQGHGITTRLEGELTVSSATTGSDPFRIVGEVRTVEGRFRAWGQALNVETGEVRFSGPYGNPSLNLLAIRPDIQVRAGVRVTGTLEAPRLTLFSEPEMSQAEKLSWVVLGRESTSSTGSDDSSMQQAALGLLAGGVGSSIAGDLGLDELGLGESGVSIGKRLSDKLYVTYEAGLSGAVSTLYVFYDITRRLTVRGQTSDSSAIDFIYTITYD